MIIECKHQSLNRKAGPVHVQPKRILTAVKMLLNCHISTHDPLETVTCPLCTVRIGHPLSTVTADMMQVNVLGH